MSERLDFRKVLEQARQQIAATEARPSHTEAPPIEELTPHFPDFELLELLGVGGMGAVYRARDGRHARDVAIKVLSKELASDPAFAERFDREGRALGQLDHPNIVRVFGSGHCGPWLYIVMEYVDGVDLRRWMDLGGFSPDAALELLKPLCSALRHAHERGIVHRDIKPQNILIDQDGSVKLADFGLAKVADESDWGLTRTNQGLGTLHYMAPEQLEGANAVDHRADIFSLGVVVYEMLTGELPHGRFERPSVKAPNLRGVDRVVLRSMDRNPDRRYQSVEVFELELQQGRKGKRVEVVVRKTDEQPVLELAVLLAWLGFALAAVGWVVLRLESVAIGMVVVAVAMVLGFVSLPLLKKGPSWGPRLAAALAAGIPAGIIFWMLAFQVLAVVLPFSNQGWYDLYVIVALVGTLAWIVGATVSGKALWFTERRKRVQQPRRRQAGRR